MDEPGWERNTLSPDSSKVIYTRPLLGSEAVFDQLSVLVDNYADCCMGVTFSSTLSSNELYIQLKGALVRLRHCCPIMAATPQRGIHDPDLRSWVYVPLSNVQEAQAWAEESVCVLQEPVDPSSFIQRMNARKLPYVLDDGRQQFVRVYLVRPSSLVNVFAIFFHGPHTLLDGKPTLDALSLLFEFMSTPQSTSLSEIEWGTEAEKLPPGPMVATGGRKREWESTGISLFKKVTDVVMNPTLPHHLTRRVGSLADPEAIQRASIELTETETRNILQALKSTGYSITHLLEAATALALFALKPVPASCLDTAHITFGASMISLEGRLSPPYDVKPRLVSSLVLLPVRITWEELGALEGKSRLLAAMAQSKAYYSAYLGNPCVFQFTAEHMRVAPLRDVDKFGRPGCGVVTNIGRIDDHISKVWPRRNDGESVQMPPVFRVDRLHFGHRLVPEIPNVHCWTMNSRLTVQLQAADVWEEATPHEYLNEIVKHMLILV